MPANSDRPKSIAIIGAGSRGAMFGELIRNHPFLGQIAAVAEPREERRQAIADRHAIPPELQFRAWQDLAARPKLCDAVVISTLDRDHAGPAVVCLEKGYDVLLEKPMASTLDDCRRIEAAQRKTGRIVGVCHSLRYQKAFRKLRDLIAGGAIGRVVSLDHIEQVCYWHQAHSFVRGNWGNEGRSSSMLLAKSCHDLDYISYLVDRPCLRVCSFGALTHFRPENAPAGAPERCTDGCPVEATCPYSAIRLYVHANRAAWPAEVISQDHSLEVHLQAIRTGPYGRCVYRADNDVVDHQVVALEFADDVTATFTMTAFTQGGGRRTRVHGTEGEATFDEGKITIRTFADNNTTTVAFGPEPGGHGGGDARVVREWLQALHSGGDSRIVANAQESLKTHTIVFAAEKSRRDKRMVELSEML